MSQPSKSNFVHYLLNEPDLKTPEHDKIVIWVSKNWYKIIKPHLPEEPKHPFTEEEKQFWNDFLKKYPNSYSTIKVCECGTEYHYYSAPHKNCTHPHSCTCASDRFDALREAKENYNQQKQRYELLANPDNAKVILESPITTEKGFTIGFWDVCVRFRDKNGWEKNKVFGEIYALEKFPYQFFFFEIKPEIKSIGEVLRQINFYKTESQGTYILITKTRGLETIFESQNIDCYVVTDEQLDQQ